MTKLKQGFMCPYVYVVTFDSTDFKYMLYLQVMDKCFILVKIILEYIKTLYDAARFSCGRRNIEVSNILVIGLYFSVTQNLIVILLYLCLSH